MTKSGLNLTIIKKCYKNPIFTQTFLIGHWQTNYVSSDAILWNKVFKNSELLRSKLIKYLQNYVNHYGSVVSYKWLPKNMKNDQEASFAKFTESYRNGFYGNRFYYVLLLIIYYEFEKSPDLIYDKIKKINLATLYSFM